MTCIIGKYCLTHQFIYGAEAEELRQRLELSSSEAGNVGRRTAKRLAALLDDVDARDSAAFLWTKGEGMKDVKTTTTKPVNPKTGKGGKTVTK